MKNYIVINTISDKEAKLRHDNGTCDAFCGLCFEEARKLKRQVRDHYNKYVDDKYTLKRGS